MFDNALSGIEWAQGLSPLLKFVVSLILSLVYGFLLLILWQKPPEIAPDKRAPGITNQSGNAASSGQSGGVTAGVYVNQAPPVAAQQKEEALSSLQSQIEDLAEFSNRPDVSEPRTLLEQVTINKLPHRLFTILNKYDKQTITSVPKVGEELFNYKKAYDEFENKEYDFENEATSHIGKSVTVRFRVGWSIYFRYFLLRSAGLTKQQIIDGGNFLNYDITWDDSEHVFDELTKAPAIGPVMAEKLSLQKSMLAAATSIISTYKRP